VDDGVERPPGLGQIVVEGLYLLQRTRVTVQQEARGTVALRQPVFHDFVGDLVAHIPAGLHDRPHLPGQRRIGGLHSAENVTSRNRRDLIVLSDQLGLRTLACARWAHDDELH
jgi:hypothetical protein